MKSAALCILAFASLCSAQLTREQKMQDFQQLASLYAKHYAPYEWKKQVQSFDLLDISSWLNRAASSKSDLEFYEICAEYLSKLNDGHVNYFLPTDFTASLGFGVDVYDNTIVVDSVNRTRLPAAQYPINVGDELVSVDGVSAPALALSLAKYAVAANPRSTLRVAASYIPSRSQRVLPRAVELGEEAVVVLRSASGEEKTLTIPWFKSGTPLLEAGPVPTPKVAVPNATLRSSLPMGMFEDDPPYMAPLRALQNARVGHAIEAIQGWGSRTPLFSMPANFTQRLGRQSSDYFFSGTFESEGVKLGFIRIPSYSPSSLSAALQQFQNEIIYMQANTDGLIVDNTRNPGGNVCYVEALLSYLIPHEFRGGGFEIRATSFWVTAFSSTVTQLRSLGAPDSIIDQYEALLETVQEANNKNRGRTPPISLCSTTTTVEPARDRQGSITAYSKPVMVLADDLSASSGDLLPALFQDARRGPVVGWRTMGLGGTVTTFPDATVFSEGEARITLSLMTRAESRSIDGFPSTTYVENVGVKPDLQIDYQTRDNLLNNGKPYFDVVTWVMVQHVNGTMPQF